MKQPASFPYSMMKANGGNVILSPMPIQAIRKHFSGFMITPESDGYWFVNGFRHYKTIINPKIEAVN